MLCRWLCHTPDFGQRRLARAFAWPTSKRQGPKTASGRIYTDTKIGNSCLSDIGMHAKKTPVDGVKLPQESVVDNFMDFERLCVSMSVVPRKNG